MAGKTSPAYELIKQHLINEEFKCSPNSRIVHVYQGLDTNEGIMIIIHYTNDGSGKER